MRIVITPSVKSLLKCNIFTPYTAGNDIPRALDLCFRAGEDPTYTNNAVVYDMLNTIAQVCSV